MKQLGNLAVVCAQRPDVLMQIYDKTVRVHVGEGPGRTTLFAPWEDDDAILRIIQELNFGRYAVGREQTQGSKTKSETAPLYALVLAWDDDGFRGTKVMAVSRDKDELRRQMKKSVLNIKAQKAADIICGPPIVWEDDRLLPDGRAGLIFSYRHPFYLGISSTWMLEIQEAALIPNGGRHD